VKLHEVEVNEMEGAQKWPFFKQLLEAWIESRPFWLDDAWML